MKNIIKNSFYQLIVIYTGIVLLITFGLLSRYALQFNVLAIVIGLFGAFSLKQEKTNKLNKNLHYSLLILGLVLIFVVRVIPYLFTSVPLGYDPGIYKYGIESGLENQDEWILRGGMEPGFLYLMQPLKMFFSTDFILKYIFILFCVFLGLAVYLVSKEYFDDKTALISLFVFALSLIQFKTFWFLYYKNVIGLSTALFSVYFLERYKNTKSNTNLIFFILLGGLTGAIHRPTFYIYAISYLFYAFISPYSQKSYNFKVLGRNILTGIAIIAIFMSFYIGKFLPAVTSILPWIAEGFIEPGQAPGTFINLFTYQYSILPYFLLSVVGLVFCIRKRLSLLGIWAILNLAIVYFQFFFFNRFIIMLDIVLIIFASKGFSLLIQDKKKLGIAVVLVLVASMGVLAFNEARNSNSLVDEAELEVISYLSQTPENSWVMSTSSYYSTWIIGYSYRKTIAPGLFDYDVHSEEEWVKFWTTNSLQEVKDFLGSYEKPLYIFIGKRQKDNLSQFPECFEVFYEKESSKIYEYLC